jgi:hypothetical protein
LFLPFRHFEGCPNCDESPVHELFLLRVEKKDQIQGYIPEKKAHPNKLETSKNFTAKISSD